MKTMMFLRTVVDAVLDRSPEELIGAMIFAIAVAIVMSGLYKLGRHKAIHAPTLVGVLVFAGGILCMALAAGYIERSEAAGMPRPGTQPARSPGDSNRRTQAGPWASNRMHWSSGFHVMVAADEDHNGHLTREEATHLVQRADTDGDGSVNFQDIDRLIISRFHFPIQNPSAAGPRRHAREEGREPLIDHEDGPRPSDDEDSR